MSSFKCPFCNQVMSVDSGTERDHRVNFYGNSPSSSSYLLIQIFKCPNCECESVVLRGLNGYCEDKTEQFYPGTVFEKFPDYVPEAIRRDYEEAMQIADLSPKAAATLARRCLQGMIHDYWNIKGKNLNAEITELKAKVSDTQWQAIDGLRKLGNIGAHMEKDIDLIVEVEPDEAKMLLNLIELLIDKWYIARHDEEKLFIDIVAVSSEKEAARQK